MGTPWQKILAHRLRTVLGSRLYIPANDPNDWTAGDNQPTPEAFKNKILLVVHNRFLLFSVLVIV